MYPQRCFLIVTVILISLAYYVPLAVSENTTTTSKDSQATTTPSASPSTTSQLPTVQTTVTTTLTTTTTTTTTEPTTTTTEAPAKLGDDCSSKNNSWCDNAITGTAICNGTICVCDAGFFRKDSSTCLNETILKPVTLNFNESDISATSLVVRWFMTENLNWKFDVSCTGVRSNSPKTQTQLNIVEAPFTGLTSGDEYDVNVTAYFTDDAGETNSGMETARQAIDPAIPGGVISSNYMYTAPDIILQWNSSDGFVDTYTIVLENKLHNTSNNESMISLDGLTAGTTYDVTITAFSHGRSSEKRSDMFTTSVAAPGQPLNLANISSTQTSITLKWDPPSDPNGNLTGYLVCYEWKVYSDLNDFSMGGCFDVGNVQQHEVDLPKPGAFYDFDVYSMNTEYNSTSSANLTAVRTLEAEPGLVAGLNVQVNNLSLEVTWQRPAEPNGDIIQYRIEWSSDNISCTDYLNTGRASLPNTTTGSQNCSDSTGGTIDVNEKDMNVTISGLTPYTNYTTTVTPYTSVGPGTNSSTTSQTSVVKPDPVTNVIAAVLNSTAVMVNWTRPAVDPGPVSYTVTAIDMIGLTGQQNEPGCSVEGWEKSSCVVAGLEEYWVYQFGVVASTQAGSSEATKSENTTTEEGEPLPISHFNSNPYNSEFHCDATKININWREPKLVDRNGKITAYVIKDSPVYPVTDPDPYRLISRQFSYDIVGLQAERTYLLTIRAETETGHDGLPYNFSFTTESCAPLAWPIGTSISEIPAKQTISSFTVTLQRAFFINKVQGQVRERGLIISKTNGTLAIATVKENTWSTSKASSFNTPYAIPFEVPSSNTFNVTVGQNATCVVNDKLAKCNGQLPSSQKFYVMAYACTSNDKCTASPFYGAYSTAARPVTEEPASVGPIIAGVLVAVGLFVIIAALVILQRRGTIDMSKIWRRKASERSIVSIEDPVQTKRPMPSERGPVRLSEFDTYLMELHKDTNLLFSCQYEDIGKLSKVIYDKYTIDAANLEDNKAKNRWVNILPFDHSRVKLQQLDDDDPTSDYINANFIPGLKHQRDYIATQGPLPGTIDDFWRMVWEHNVAIIVMLTQCKEGNRVKCENYWPNEIHEPKQYGDVVVDPVSISTMNMYNITIFHVSVNDVKRTVYHFHYLEFPDMSANVEYDVFLEFLQVVRSHVPRNIESPLVIHCSAGVGRTGTFIALDRLSQLLSRRDFSWDMKVDIFDMVVGMRNNRTNMVQTESQYVMIHDCLSKLLEVKKRATEVEVPDESLYANEAYDPYPEVLYENLKGNEMKTDL